MNTETLQVLNSASVRNNLSVSGSIDCRTLRVRDFIEADALTVYGTTNSDRITSTSSTTTEMAVNTRCIIDGNLLMRPWTISIDPSAFNLVFANGGLDCGLVVPKLHATNQLTSSYIESTTFKRGSLSSNHIETTTFQTD